MNGLPGNPHSEAVSGIEDAVVFSADDSPTQATEYLLSGIKDAVLALAYEQRTATLLSQHQYALNLHLGGEKSITSEELNKLNEQIEERMGMSDL